MLKSWKLQFKIALFFSAPISNKFTYLQRSRKVILHPKKKRFLTHIFKFCRFIDIYKYILHVLHVIQYHTVVLTVYDMTATMAFVPSGQVSMSQWSYITGLTTGDWGVWSLYSLLSARRSRACTGNPIVCLPICQSKKQISMSL